MSHLVINVFIAGLKICISYGKIQKGMTSGTGNCMPQSVSPSDKKDWKKGWDLLAVYDWGWWWRGEAYSRPNKNLALESDPLNKAFHLRKSIIMHSFSWIFITKSAKESVLESNHN